MGQHFTQIDLCYMNGLISLQKKNTVKELPLLSTTLYISASSKFIVSNLHYEVSTEYIPFFTSRLSIGAETNSIGKFLCI